jgi:DinB superfamily
MRQQLSDIIAFLEETPEAVRRLREGLVADDLRMKADGGGFSFVETVCHLRDIEREGYGVRIERILGEEGPSLPDLKGARLALERRYNEQGFDDGLAAFSQARARNLSALRAATGEQLSRHGTLEGAGEITLAGLAALMCEHDRGHREELRHLREQLTAGRQS